MATRLLIFGRKYVTVRVLEWLLTLDGVEVCGVVTDSHFETSPTVQFAKMHNIRIFEYAEVVSNISSGALRVDLALSVLFWRKFSAEVIDNIPLGIINFHPAPLPEYKGTAGYNLAVLEGRYDWAISAHYVDENIDTGPIIDVEYFEIDYENETALTLEKKSMDYMFDQVVSVLGQALNRHEKLPTTPNGQGRYVSRDEMEQMKEIKKGDDIERKIRAFWFPPYHGAYLIVDGVKYTQVSRKILASLVEPNTTNLFSTEPD